MESSLGGELVSMLKCYVISLVGKEPGKVREIEPYKACVDILRAPAEHRCVGVLPKNERSLLFNCVL